MLRPFVVLLVVIVILGSLLVGSAFAQSGQDFGKMVSTCAQTMGGFTGDMNPGVQHQGYSGWTPNHTCPM